MCDLPAGTLGGQISTRVPFSDSPLRLTFPSEQFWGRAARASWVRENPDARLILGGADTSFDVAQGTHCPRKPSAKPKAKPKAAGEGARSRRANSICGNGEVHRDASLRFHGLAVLDVGFEVPLLHRLASSGSQDARATENL